MFKAPFEMQYTYRERTVKSKKLSDITAAAMAVLKEKYKIDKLCIDQVKQFDDESTFTIQEMNQLVENLIDDTLYWEGEYLGTS